MAQKALLIKRYPNRRLYARHAKKYVTLEEVEELIREGNNVEIRDSQTGEDITRPLLTQLILEKHPEKMTLFPTAMLHFILRSNDVMSEFLRSYFRDALSYLEYLQRTTSESSKSFPAAWGPWWWRSGASPAEPADHNGNGNGHSENAEVLARKLHELEEKVRRLEGATQAEEENKDQVAAGK